MNSLGDWIIAITFFFFWLMALWIFVSCFLDVFRRDDLGGGIKAVWILFMLVLPFLGCLAYHHPPEGHRDRRARAGDGAGCVEGLDRR